MPKQQTRVAEETIRNDSPFPRRSVYLLENDARMREGLEERLVRHRFDIVVYQDPLEMARAIDTHAPDAIFIDLDSTEFAGEQLVAELVSRGCSGVIVGITSSRDGEMARAVLRAGAAYILFKPIGDLELDMVAEKIGSISRGGRLIEAVQAVLEPVEQGSVILGERGEVLYANGHAHEVLGVASTEQVAAVVGKHCSEHLLAQCKEKQAAITYHEFPRPGEDRSILLGVELCYLESVLGAPCYLMLLHDFSGWKKLDELRSRFATSLSHRMRTPLTALRNAVQILSDKKDQITSTEKERLLDIGCRNIEKLVTNLDELQKVFMIESEEMNVCRTLIRIKKEIKQQLDELEREGEIRGYKLKMPDVTAFAGRARIKDFMCTAVEAFTKWMGEAPYIECAISVHGDHRDLSGQGRDLKIVLRARFHGKRNPQTKLLQEFLSYNEAHLSLVFDRLATALDSEIEVCSGNAISMFMPTDPPFDREKDLVHPLLIMAERAELTSGAFHLVTLKTVGVISGGHRFMSILDRILCTCLSDEVIVSRGEELQSYSLFFINKTADEVEETMQHIQRRFLRSCSESGEEIYPSIRWQVRCRRKPDSGGPCVDVPLIEELI